MDFLIALKRRLDPVVGKLRLRPAARFVYRRLLSWRYGHNGMATVRQNDRTWKYHLNVALRGELAEFETIEWLRRVVRPGAVVLDIGANVGQMTLEAAVLVGLRGKVVAVEPAAGNVRLLTDHVRANGFADRVEIVPATCGVRHGGESTLHVVGDRPDAVGSGHRSVPQAHPVSEQTVAVRVPAVSIDGLCRDRGLSPAVIKIDVEGAELEVLRGAMDTLIRYRPAIRFGFHPFAFPDPAAATAMIRQLFADCGYKTLEPGSAGAYDLADYEPCVHVVG